MRSIRRFIVCLVLLFAVRVAEGALPTATPVTPSGVAVDAMGNLYIADYGIWQVLKVTPATGAITTLGEGLMSQGSATSLAVDELGNLFVSDGQSVVRKVDAATGGVRVVAGGSPWGDLGDGGPATAATLLHPRGIAVDRAGNLYIAEWSGNRVRKVTTNGIITTVAGNGSSDFYGDDGLAVQAGVPNPSGIAVDAVGNLYIAEWANNDVNRVRVVDADTGIIRTFAGNGYCGVPEDGGIATEQGTCGPWAIAIGKSGMVFVADVYHRVYLIDPETKTLLNIAGTGLAEFSGDDGPAANAGLNTPYAVAVDSAENLYIADSHNNRVRRVDVRTLTITTVVGNGIPSDAETRRRRAVGH